MSEGTEAARRSVRSAALELLKAAGDPAELARALAVLLRSGEIDDALLAGAAKLAVCEAPLSSLRPLLVVLTPALAPAFGGDPSLAIGSLIEARDPVVGAHHRAVEAAAVRLARSLNFDRERLGRVAHASRFFDAGKLFVPPEILHGAGPLDRESWPLVKKHVEDGWNLAGAIPSLAQLAGVVRAHHERVDGHGYPDGIDARSIPREASVIALADAWVAVVSSRPFRPPMTIREAVLMLEDGRGSQWDYEAVDALMSVVHPRKLKRGSPAGRPVRGAGTVRARRT